MKVIVTDIESKQKTNVDQNISTILNQAQEIQEDINFMTSKVEELDRVYSDMITSPAADGKLAARCSDIKGEINHVKDEIEKELESLKPNDRLDFEALQGVEQRIRTAQYNTLSLHYRSVCSVHRQANMEYEKRVKQRVKRQLSIQGQSKAVSEEDINLLIENEDFPYFKQDMLISDGPGHSLEGYMEREAEVKNLEKRIVTLNHMFKDIKVVVAEQGEMIDNIEHNVMRSYSYVERGTDNLSDAEKYKKKFRKRKVAFGLVVCLLLLIAAVIIVTHFV